MSETHSQSATPQKGNRRSCARLSAVQALFQMDIGGTPSLKVVEEFLTHRVGEVFDGETLLKVDKKFFNELVMGVVSQQTKLDPAINAALVEGWALNRIDTVMRAILRSGSYELLYCPAVPKAVVISEYLDVTSAFLGDEEVKLVHGVLDAIGKTQLEPS